jgi:sugar/nucleoside kinase (ribokinase family)
MKILVAGELNPDLVFSRAASLPQPGREVLAEAFSLQLGSSSAICAAGLAKLGNDVSFIGKVGPDPFGQFCLDALRRAGVEVSPVLVEPTLQTGITASISAGDRALITCLGAIAALRAEDVPESLLRRHRHLHVASYYLQRALQPGLAGLFAAARRLGLTTSLDPGCDPQDRWGPGIYEVLPHADVLLVNEVELAGLTGESGVEDGLRKLAGGHTLVVAKLGARGCAALDDAAVRFVPAIPVNAIDTTGAGDSFDAGFLHAWLRRYPLEECLRCGVVCGGLSTLGLGGTASQPSWDQLQEHLTCTTPQPGC